MRSRERLLQALAHEEPDRVPFDLGGTPNTGIHRLALESVLPRIGHPDGAVEVGILPLQLASIPEDVLSQLRVDTRGVWTNPGAGWRLQIDETSKHWTYRDEFGLTKAMPKKGGLYFDPIERPLSGDVSADEIDAYPWPRMDDPARVDGLRERVSDVVRRTEAAVVMNTFYVGIFELGSYLRGYREFLCDLALRNKRADRLLSIATEMRIQYWELVLDEIGDSVDVVAENDDLGVQDRLMISPQMYRELIKPLHRRVFSFIRKKAPHVNVLLHSCGAIRELIPDLIEAGVDSLNPIQVSAAGMDTKALKRDFGDALTFWGGGIDTQGTLPHGTPSQVRDEVRRRIEDLADGGGFVFSAVHSIQADVPPENVLAMCEALREYGVYRRNA
jgi:uroporphyrinogen decarboxylase